MSPTPADEKPDAATMAAAVAGAMDDAEKGMYDAEKGMYDGPPKLDWKPPNLHYSELFQYNKSILFGLANMSRTTLASSGSSVLPVTSRASTPLSTAPTLAVPWPKEEPPAAATVQVPAAAKPSPKVTKPPVSRWILFVLWFNTYRKFFVFVIGLNLSGIIMAALGRFHYAENHLGALVLGNLLFAVMVRNELFVRFLYMLCIYGLRSWAPVSFKLAATSALQHAGGIHSGCALSGAAWLVYKIIDIVRHHTVQPFSILATGILTNICIVVSILSAFPWIRNRHHNVFESYHRFIGWLGLAMTWIFVILGNSYDLNRGAWHSDANSLLSLQEFYFALFMTIFILIPWVTLRKVPVKVEIPSPKVAVLRFDRGMQQSLLGRISRTSVLEYHAFGTISEGRHAPYHYMVCGVQGDFTRGLVSHPPTSLWTRQLKFAGVGHASAMFKRGIRVCTGTGIGAALSTCMQSRDWFLIWVGSNQEETFGPTILGLIHKHIEPERMILWDSKRRGGRPDTMQLIKDTWKSFGAEVVFITSNMQGNDEMMQGCRAAGIHAFGTLWDF